MHAEGLCLDLGCRDRIYEKDFRGEYVGVDISRGGAPPDVTCDAEHLPFRPRIFQTVVAFHVVEHLDHPRRLPPRTLNAFEGWSVLRYYAERSEPKLMVGLYT
jgi:hypothetical protein